MADWAGRQGVEHHVLVWRHNETDSAGQEAARIARYGLLTRYCRGQGILHLLVGHHARDQAETVLMRLVRGSGPDGLAGMRRMIVTPHGRILRPLLEFGPERLRASLVNRAQSWIDDPSNSDERYARGRIRRAWPSLEPCIGGIGHIVRLAEAMRSARDLMEDRINALLARTVRLHPSGCCWLDVAELMASPEQIRLRAVAQVIASTGGSRWLPRLPLVERVLPGVGARVGAAATAGRCRVERTARHLFFGREARGLPAAIPLATLDGSVWDHRFAVRFEGAVAPDVAWQLQPVGSNSVHALLAAPASCNLTLPISAWPALPAIVDRLGIVRVPHLDYLRPDAADLPFRLDLRFFPRIRMAAGARAFLV
jgi:tRNA(Ile)-lysidine synthase